MFELSQIPLAPLALGFAHWIFIIPICLLSIFLTLLILVQRGRGGGLTGALGGMGGQSAFGAKAGDLFTKITIITAMFWILLSMGALRVLHVSKFGNTVSNNTKAADKTGDKTGDETKTDDSKNPGPGITPETTPPPTSGTPSNTPASDAPASSPPAAPPASTPATPPPADNPPPPADNPPDAPPKNDK